jgi:hypothetical protein
VYAPDAIGAELVGEFPELFDRVRALAPVEVAVRSPVPSVTPVCFATMLTGAPPAVHGIETYEKPVLRCDTVFDAVLRAGRQVAIVTVAGSSIDLMYRERELTYHIEPDDHGVTQRTLSLLAQDTHDLILAYHQAHDDALHRTTARSPDALAAMREHVRSFLTLGHAAASAWGGRSWGIAFTPDHGSHLDPETGRGTHGSDRDQDVQVLHFWGTSSGR